MNASFTLLGSQFSVSASAEGYGETSPKRASREGGRVHVRLKVRR
jgi:hypothetical protein